MSTDRRDVDRILEAALDEPGALAEADLDRALELLGSDAKRVRVGAAWAFGIVADDDPGQVMPYVPRIAELLEEERGDGEAARALAYVSQATPAAIERELRALEEALARRCREALWGQLAPRTVVRTPNSGAKDGSASMGHGGGDRWGWVGGGSATTYDTDRGTRRRRPPTDRPIDPPAVEYDYDQFTPTEPLHRSELATTFRVVYHTPDGEIHPGLFKRFNPPNVDGFRSAFDRRIGMWAAIDDHDTILPIVDYGTDPEPWFVTAYEGATGVAALGDSGRLDAAIWTLGEVLDALRYAHDRGVIHGVLTPGAIVRTSMISQPDAWRYPRITDWGYLHRLGREATPAAIPKRYLAPEHVDPDAFSAVDGATDIYGFGTVLAEAVLGSGAIEKSEDGTNAIDSLPSVPDPDDRLPGLGDFLRRCLADRKAERFGTVAAMAVAFGELREAVDG